MTFILLFLENKINFNSESCGVDDMPLNIDKYHFIGHFGATPTCDNLQN